MKALTVVAGALFLASLSSAAFAADKPTSSTYAGGAATSSMNREAQKIRSDLPQMASHYRALPFVRERTDSGVATRVGFRSLGVERWRSTTNGTTERQTVRVFGRAWTTTKTTDTKGATTTEKFSQHMKPLSSGEHTWKVSTTSSQPLGHGAVLRTSTKAEGGRNGGTLRGLWLKERTGVWADGQSKATVSVRGADKKEHVVNTATATKSGAKLTVTESGSFKDK